MNEDDHPVFRNDPAKLRWNGDGSYTPFCPRCEWEGKTRLVHADAEAAIRSHVRSKKHTQEEDGA